MHLKFILKIESTTQDDLRHRLSNQLHVLKQWPGIPGNTLWKNKQHAEICIDENEY